MAEWPVCILTEEAVYVICHKLRTLKVPILNMVLIVSIEAFLMNLIMDSLNNNISWVCPWSDITDKNPDPIGSLTPIDSIVNQIGVPPNFVVSDNASHDYTIPSFYK